ncbi:MAG: hypothetical protein J2P56_07045, partial [Verrucomicrobia bacterium]|nr:hypothetical protein [Verrucomicrobiota bacterium]
MWRRVFYWSPPGRVSFRASSDFEQPSSIIRRLAASLARDLNASLIGDEGEIYLFRCPCCGFRTLSERSSWEICAVCWWEDDGQDDPNADEVWGGPNDKYSLSAARANFLSHGHMYDQGKGIRVVERPSPERSSLLEYVRSVLSGQEDLDDGTLQEMINAAKSE